MYNLVGLETDPPVAWITLNRPKSLNALNTRLLEELRAALCELEEDGGIAAIAIIGAGERAFCAGADVEELASLPADQVLESNLLGHGVFELIERLRKPVIAAINGYALGGGLELALSCDLRLAASDSQMGLPEVRLGVIPGWGGTWRLREAVGSGRAREMILTGRLLEAGEALEAGLLSRVVPGDRLREEVRELAVQLSGNSPEALAAAKGTLLASAPDARVLARVESGSVASLVSGEEFRRRFERMFGKRGGRFDSESKSND